MQCESSLRQSGLRFLVNARKAMSGRPHREAERFMAGVAWESFGENNVCWIGPDQTRWVPSD